MKPADIQNFLKWRQQASLDDFVRNFGPDREQVRAVLEQLVQEGKLRKHYVSNCCNSGCDTCDPTMTEYYEWADS
jgi:hypothetical protein